MQIAKYSLSKTLNRIKLIDIGAYKTKIELWTVGLQTQDVNLRKRSVLFRKCNLFNVVDYLLQKDNSSSLLQRFSYYHTYQGYWNPSNNIFTIYFVKVYLLPLWNTCIVENSHGMFFLEETILPLYTAYVVSCLGKHFILYVKGCSYYFLVNTTSTLQFHWAHIPINRQYMY